MTVRLATTACAALCMLICAAESRGQFNPLSVSTTGSYAGYEYRFIADPAATTDSPRPLVVALHGAGERGTDNKEQLRHFGTLAETLYNDPNFHGFFLAPQVLPGDSWDGAAIGQLVQQIITLNPGKIDTCRIYVTGLSMGGQGTYRAIGDNPGLFAAGIALSATKDVLASRVKELAKTPLWMIHGDADNTVNLTSHSVEMYTRITNNGGTPRFDIVPNWGHSDWDRVYAEQPRYLRGINYNDDSATIPTDGLYDWLFTQTKTGPVALATQQLQESRRVLVDIGTRTTDSLTMRRRDTDGTYWNNLVGPDQSGGAIPQGTQIHHAYDDQGHLTTITVGTSGSFGTFKTDGASGGTLLPAAAQGDSFVLSASTHAEAVDTHGYITLGGLEAGRLYRLKIFGSRDDDDGGKGLVARFTVNDEFRDLDVAHNTTRFALFESLTADANGKLVIDVSISPDSTSRRTGISAIELTALNTVPEPASCLLLLSLAAFWRPKR